MSNFWNDEMQNLLESVKFDKEEKTVHFDRCPICGEKITIYDGTLDDNYMNGYYIQCECGLEFSIGECTLEELATMWNVRKPIKEIVNRLEEEKTKKYNDWNKTSHFQDLGGYRECEHIINIVKEVVGEINE